jgi:hypothetical protein
MRQLNHVIHSKEMRIAQNHVFYLLRTKMKKKRNKLPAFPLILYFFLSAAGHFTFPLSAKQSQCMSPNKELCIWRATALPSRVPKGIDSILF